jgi:hypothetical protein
MEKALRKDNLFINPFGDIEKVEKLDFRNSLINEYTFASCKPIVLTEEWLLKMGFGKDEFFFAYNSGTTTSFVIIKGDTYFQFPHWEGRDRVIIKHVHQLQNLFYCLSGEELTIK